MAGAFGVNLLPWQQNERNRPALLKSIQNISQFHGAVGHFEVVVDDGGEDNGWVPDVILGRRTLVVAQGTVNAYVEMSGFADEDLTLSEDGRSLKVRLPDAQLDKPNINHEKSYVASQERGAVERIKDALETPKQEKFYQDAEKKITAAAKESGPRKRALENTKSMLTGMSGSLEIEVTFVE
ncbi:DUF4230 domain-containing protein [Paeniglutamicibacter sp. MACA_103]|uniref:DUF4230 domain-containing protein n=1 Tax=Paeniglutamicibacter sp. MACA_103 TaxID=3377337 RepID=UPI0038950107